MEQIDKPQGFLCPICGTKMEEILTEKNTYLCPNHGRRFIELKESEKEKKKKRNYVE